jgi:hypothetical protein
MQTWSRLWPDRGIRAGSLRPNFVRGTFFMAWVREAGTSRVGGWLFDQPYLLLALTSLFWASNIVLGRVIVGHVPPIALAFIRRGGACLVLLPAFCSSTATSRSLVPTLPRRSSRRRRKAIARYPDELAAVLAFKSKIVRPRGTHSAHSLLLQRGSILPYC